MHRVEPSLRSSKDAVPRSLRYLPTDVLAGSPLDFATLEVRSARDEHDWVGTVEGFIVDSQTVRLHQVIVDCGAWFAGGSYLVPPGCTRLDGDARILWVDLTRDAISRLPRFDALDIEELAADLVGHYERHLARLYRPASADVSGAQTAS
jgi:hypothetical protein